MTSAQSNVIAAMSPRNIFFKPNPPLREYESESDGLEKVVSPNKLPVSSGPESKVQIGNFRLGKTIGVGSFGKVKIGEHVLTGHKVAVKILNRKKIKSLRMDLKIRREITIMKLFRHPHIVQLYEVIETPTDIFMVMEYVQGGELFDYIVSNGKLSEDDARRFFQQIISGVEYCHSHMVVHRDLKPENLLIDTKNQCVKIADFGLSNMMHDGDFLKTSCGSPNYAAPEVISGKLYAGPEVDVWSCGVILYTLLCARLPFDDEYIPSLFKKIREGIFNIPSFVSPQCRDLINTMLVVDPLKRITISELRRHPWFQVNLPKYLMYPSKISCILESLDQDVVGEISAKFAVEKEAVLEALQNADQTSEVNEFVVAYHLIKDSKRVYTDKAGDPLGSLSTSPTMNLRDLSDSINGIANPFRENGLSPPTSASAAISSRQVWYLGLVSSLPPNHIMQEVFRALKTIGFEWKILGPFQLRCRYRYQCPSVAASFHLEEAETKEHMVKVNLQLYKVKEKKYLLDIKKMEGETFPFFDICSKLLKELHL